MSDDVDQNRRGIILTSYHAEQPRGDVLTDQGEVLGTWYMDEEEWCFFVADGHSEPSLEAPSPWLLHDRIADWYETKKSAGG